MRCLRITFTLCLTLACLLLPAMASHPRRHTVRAHSRRAHHSSRLHAHKHASRARTSRKHSLRGHAASPRPVPAVPARERTRKSEPPHTRRAKPQSVPASERTGRNDHPSAAPAGITPLRATEIQNALIRAGYLRSGSGVWDAETVAAMRRYQQDHQWQTRLVPDARALIALGLGPHLDQRALYPVVASTAPPTPAARRSSTLDSEMP